MLRTTGHYYPDKKKTPEEHLIDLKVLMGARTSFNKSVHDNPCSISGNKPNSRILSCTLHVCNMTALVKFL